MPSLPETAQYKTTPDWVCEVLSPGNAATDRGEKLPFYGRAGVRHVWLVDPVAELLEVFRLDDVGWRVARIWRGAAVVRAEPFEVIELPLARLWKRTADDAP